MSKKTVEKIIKINITRDPLMTIDQKNQKNPNIVAHYVDDIISFYLKNEIEQCIKFKTKIVFVDFSLKQKIGKFLNLWSFIYDFSTKTCFLASFLLFNFLNKNDIPKSKIASFFIASVNLACKYEETKFYEIE